jgi:hypothetical protein
MKISFLDAAQSELDGTIDYYEEQRSGLGFEFAEEVEEALERVNHYPEAWSHYRRAYAVASSIDFLTV